MEQSFQWSVYFLKENPVEKMSFEFGIHNWLHMLVTHVPKTQKFLLGTEEMSLLHNFASPLVGRAKEVN